MDDYENPLPGKTYISPALKSFSEPARKVRIATKLIEQPETYAYAQEKGEIVGSTLPASRPLKHWRHDNESHHR